MAEYKDFDKRSPEQINRDRELQKAYRDRRETYECTVGGITLAVNPGVFPPDIGLGIPRIIEAIEFLVSNDLKNIPRETLVGIDIGTGTGILALKLAEFCAKVYATDTSVAAVQNAESNFLRYVKANPDRSIHCWRGDLFESIPELNKGEVPIIVFNQPYYPSPVGLYDTLIPTAGASIIKRFLNEATERIGPNGRILMPYSEVAAEHNPSLFAANYNLTCEAISEPSHTETDYVYVLSMRRQTLLS